MTTTTKTSGMWEWLLRQASWSSKEEPEEDAIVLSSVDDSNDDEDSWSSLFWLWWNKPSSVRDKLPSAVSVIEGGETITESSSWEGKTTVVVVLVSVVLGILLLLWWFRCLHLSTARKEEEDDFDVSDMDASQRHERLVRRAPFSWNGAHLPTMGSFRMSGTASQAPKATTAQEHFAQLALGGGTDKSVGEEDDDHSDQGCSPLALEGPLVQHLEYIVSWNPNTVSGASDSTTHGKKKKTVGVFASSKYKSIRRKVCIDLASLAITVHLPRSNKKNPTTQQPQQQQHRRQRQGQEAGAPKQDLLLPASSSPSPKKTSTAVSSASSVQSDSAVLGHRRTSRKVPEKDDETGEDEDDGDDTATVVSRKSAASQPAPQYHHLPSYEDQLWNMTRVEFATTPHRATPISHVSNITAVPPRRGGVLELTLVLPEAESCLPNASAGVAGRRSHSTSPATPLSAAASSTTVTKRRRPRTRGRWFTPPRRRRSLSPRPSSLPELAVPTLRQQEAEEQTTASQEGKEGLPEDTDDDDENNGETCDVESSIRPTDFAGLASVGRTGPLTGQLMTTLFSATPSHSSASSTTPSGALAKSPLRRMGTFSSIGGVSATSHAGIGAGTEAVTFDARRKAKAAAAATVRSLSLTHFIPALEEVKSDDNDDDSFVVVVNQNEQLDRGDDDSHNQRLSDTIRTRNTATPNQQQEQQHRPTPLRIPSSAHDEAAVGHHTDPQRGALHRSVSSPSSPKTPPATSAPPPEKSVVEEYTFTSASDAADFQACCLALRVVGREIRNMYNALELLHMASDAYEEAEEVVLSSLGAEAEEGGGGEGEEGGEEKQEGGKEKEETPKRLRKEESVTPAGVAFYDVWQCFHEVPYLCGAMNRWFDFHYKGGSDTNRKTRKKKKRRFAFDDDDDEDEDRGTSFLISSAADATKGSSGNASNSNDNSSSTAKDRRLAVLEEYRSKRLLLGRVDFFRLFCPRSLSTLLLPTVTPSVLAASTHHRHDISKLLTLRKRVAHAAVLVRWYVRGASLAQAEEFLSPPNSKLTRRLAFDTETANVIHDVQAQNEIYEPSVAGTKKPAFSLWGFQVIRRSSSPDIINPNVDPLDFLPPTVAQTVERHAPVDFFFYVFFPQGKSMAMVLAFVRSLPPGADPKFDDIWERFKHGGHRERQRKFELMIEVGGSISSFAIQSLSSIWTQFSRFPGVNYAPMITTRHFGGDLQPPSSHRPRNYVAVTAYANPNRRFYHDLLFPAGGPLLSLHSSIANIAIAFRGQGRALGSVRLVHLNAETVAVSVAPAAAAPTPTPNSEAEKETRQTVRDLAVLDEGEDADVDALVEILEGITVPCRTPAAARKPYPMAIRPPAATTAVTSSGRRFGEQGRVTFESEAGGGSELGNIAILETVSRSDLLRFLQASDCDLRVAAVRVVESAAWRGVTFPIDTSVCRVELQSGQFFQQGRDLRGRPVFYFRNMCLGPWRRDVDATILAVLHRLETAMRREKLSGHAQQQQFTLIVCTGRPVMYKSDKSSSSGSNEGEENSTTSEGAATSKKSLRKQNLRTDVREDPIAFGANPRLDAQEEDFHVHSNYTLLQRLLELALRHYPECMAQTLVLPPASNWIKLQLPRFVTASKTRGKVVWLKSVLDLRFYVSSKELVTFCGGEAPVRRQDAFEAW